MRKYLSARVATRALMLAVPVTALTMAFAGVAGAAVTPTGVTDKIDMTIDKGKLKFVGPKTITQGDELEIVNSTDPKKVGPHTFSLVTKGSLPKTKPARQSCFTPKHICLNIAKWHGFNPKTEKISIDPVEVGPKGWSTMGSNSKKGDSWFTEKKSESITQLVSAEPSTLYFVCAVHPFMQGQVKVLPAPTTLPSPTL